MTPYIATKILTAQRARVMADTLSAMTYKFHDDDVDVLRSYALAVEGICPHYETYADGDGIERCEHCLVVIYAS